ncbi:MAG: ABC transporter permease [Arachnia sp.]
MGHHLAVYRQTWRGMIISTFLSPLFFRLALGVGLGSLVDERSGGVGGTSYLHFVVPGILAYQAALTAFGESTYPVLGLFKWNRVYFAKIATPLGVSDILLAHLLVIGGHVVVASSVFVGVAARFGSFSSWWVLAAIPVCVLTGWAFAAPVFALSASVETDNVVGVLDRFVLTPIRLVPGTYFPISQLPDWFEPVAWMTPLWHGVVLAREAASGTAPGWGSLLHFAAIGAFMGVGWVLARRAFTRRLRS